MYNIALILHSYFRWFVLFIMIYALFRAWWGVFSKRDWTKGDDTAVLGFTWLISIQFILGLILFLLPTGLANAARQNLNVMMSVRDLRFFGLEHPLQMVIALTIVHLGSARARKATPASRQFRWAAICFTLAAILILVAIPWWRPLLRGLF